MTEPEASIVVATERTPVEDSLPDLNRKQILLCVSGSIAAYKAADLASRLGKTGATLHVVMTPAATKFIAPATFQALTRNPVLTDVFDEPITGRIAHIELAQSADLVIVAPASADLMAKMAHGIADDIVTTCLLAVPQTTLLLVAPAMNTVMWEHPATRANLETLKSRGVHIVEPGYGLLACQDVGRGKLAEVSEIMDAVTSRLVESHLQDFAGYGVMITAGATREPLDPVRFLSNRSSGKMGFALAEEAARRGARVALICGFTTATPPIHPDIKIIKAETAEKMKMLCLSWQRKFDIFIGAAAVADYAPAEVSEHKIKKRNETGSETETELTLKLVRTPDILAEIARKKLPDQIVVGFAAETEDLLRNAQDKLTRKGLDMIVANDVTAEGAGFDADTNIVTLISANGEVHSLPKLTKHEVAREILNRIAKDLVTDQHRLNSDA